MREYESEIQRLAYEEYGHILDPLEEKIEKQSKELETKDKELETKDKELETKDKELKAINEENNNLNNFKSESKSKLKKLMESDNFDSNEAKKIINSILMLWEICSLKTFFKFFIVDNKEFSRLENTKQIAGED